MNCAASRSAKLDHPAEAISSFNRAIAANQDYYRPYLFRGMLHLKRGNLEIAQQDLSAANRLLPTADATFGLGDIAQRQGDTQTALRYYQAVANSSHRWHPPPASASRASRAASPRLPDGRTFP